MLTVAILELKIPKFVADRVNQSPKPFTLTTQFSDIRWNERYEKLKLRHPAVPDVRTG